MSNTPASETQMIGVMGFKNSGKTTLIEKLVAEITRRGLRVSTIKHAHHDLDLDQPGRDTYRHREAGATEVVAVTANRVAIQHQLHGSPEPSLDEIMARMIPVDLIIVEGYKFGDHEKIEAHRPANGEELIAARDANVVAVATDAPLSGISAPQLDLNDVNQVTDFILNHLGLTTAT
jgi:molybdopterin-guanine dinucleotide biosynthesis protein MobB